MGALRIAWAIDALFLHARAPGPVSRIGGPALLPAGARWPLRGPAPLTFLAAIDLSELPAHGVLPEQGVLLFFADLDALGEEDVHENRPHAAIRVLAAAAEELASAAPPAPVPPLLALPESAVGFAAAPPVGEDFGEIEFHDVVALGAGGAERVPQPLGARHRVLADGEQPGELVLLELDLGARTLAFTIDAGAARAGDVGEATARVSDR